MSNLTSLNGHLYLSLLCVDINYNYLICFYVNTFWLAVNKNGYIAK